MLPPRHGLPTDSPLTEAQEDSIPFLLPVTRDFGPHRKTLYLGNLAAAEDAASLDAAGITETLNVSINIFPGPLALKDGTQIRRYQIGLIDGAGNDPHLLAAAVLTLEGLMNGYVPAKPHYPQHRKGNILIHCRGGRSRSVTVLALWLARQLPQQFTNFDAAVAFLRQLRGLSHTHPLPPMLQLAAAAQARGLIR